jgi:hypothetical protein
MPNFQRLQFTTALSSCLVLVFVGLASLIGVLNIFTAVASIVAGPALSLWIYRVWKDDEREDRCSYDERVRRPWWAFWRA